jgi:hypothetical protein
MGSEQLLDNGKALFSALLDDMAAAQERLNKDDTQYERRVYVRTLFATIEGIVFAIKQELLEGLAQIACSHEEVAILREETYSLNSKGGVVSQKKLIPIDDNLLFVANKILAQRLSPQRIDTSGSEWFDFKKAIAIRHRITHPKSALALTITDDELAIMRRVVVWFVDKVMYSFLLWDVAFQLW